MEAINIGDVVRTRKSHPCGGDEWTVTRTGADIKIRCNTCGHVVMLDRERFLRQRKAVLYRNTDPERSETEGRITEEPDHQSAHLSGSATDEEEHR